MQKKEPNYWTNQNSENIWGFTKHALWEKIPTYEDEHTIEQIEESLEEEQAEKIMLPKKITKEKKEIPTNEKRRKIALTGWGTGGHIFPLLSLYNYLQEEDSYDFVWVGEDEWLEYDICSEKWIEFLDIPAGKLRRYFDPRNLFEPLKNITGIFFGIYFIIKYKIDIVFSKGGYVALPLCIAAFLLRKKIYIHESDTVSGITNKLIAKMATKVFYTFPNEKTDTNSKHIETGQILNGELIDGIKDLSLKENKQLEVLLIGGSQGSRRIFDAMTKILPDFLDIHFTVILWEKNIESRNDFQKFANVTIHDFVSQSQLWEIYKHTDIAVTRAGATSLFELTSFGIHSIIVPLSESAGNHQWENANYFNKKYGSDVLDEYNELETHIYRKLNAYKNLRKAGLNLDTFFDPLQKIEKELES